jgi:hypothetical protein
MFDFAHRTGLTASEQPPVRYLWTDAFAVCNFLGLFVEHGDDEALQLATRLVDQTHHVLGRHRPDDPRRGWISGLGDEEGEAHPTRGGLRIGKPLRERGPGEPSEPALEWDRDGQYFHYLTRWMHALDRMAHVTADASYHRWACELASAAYAGFTHTFASGTRRLVWKMSIDLDRPQVASTGHHDPLDAIIMYRQLQATRNRETGTDLSQEIRELAAQCAGRNWDTDDALGIGGLLCNALQLVQLGGVGTHNEPRLAEELLLSSRRGLEAVIADGMIRRGVEHRLGFRELGLSIGLHAVERAQGLVAEASSASAPDERLVARLDDLAGYLPLAGEIERFWLEPGHRESSNWRNHRDINDVMLATSLAPAGYLGPGGRPPAAVVRAAE